MPLPAETVACFIRRCYLNAHSCPRPHAYTHFWYRPSKIQKISNPKIHVVSKGWSKACCHMLSISYRDIYLFTKRTENIYSNPICGYLWGPGRGTSVLSKVSQFFCKNNIISNFIMIMLLTFKNTEMTRVTDVILLIERAKFSLYEEGIEWRGISHQETLLEAGSSRR